MYLRTSEINCGKKLCYKNIFLISRDVGDTAIAFCLLSCYVVSQMEPTDTSEECAA